MSNIRQHWLVILDGVKHEVTTSGRDMLEVDQDENANPMQQAFRLLHAACKRLELEGVPDTWEEFTDLVDDMQRLDEDDGPPRPTRPVG